MEYTPAQQDAVLQSFKRCVSYATDQLAHYEHFMGHMMPYIVNEYSRIEVPSPDGKEKHVVQLRNVVVQNPCIDDSDPSVRSLKAGKMEPLHPMEARNRGLTYSANVLVDIEHSVFTLGGANGPSLKAPPMVYREMPLFEMPVMLRSSYCYTSRDATRECWMDMGGYFIVRGNAKVLQPQKVQRINVHLVKGGKHEPVDMDIRSLRADDKFRSTSTLYMHLSGSPPIVTVDIPFLKTGLPVLVLFRLLGVDSREDVEAILWGSVDDPDGAGRRLFAVNFAHALNGADLSAVQDAAAVGLNVGADATPDKLRRQVTQQIAGELLPHVGFDDSPTTRLKKLAYLAVILRRMLDVYLGRAAPDDRDFEGYKAVQMSAGVLSVMFRQQFAASMKMLRNRVYDRCKKGKHLDISSLLSDSLSRDVLKAFSEGEVTVQKEASNAGTSVIQLAQQVNPLGIQTHIQRVSTALPRDGKYKQLRGVDPTQLQAFCPTETPEGHGCAYGRVTPCATRLVAEAALLTLISRLYQCCRWPAAKPGHLCQGARGHATQVCGRGGARVAGVCAAARAAAAWSRARAGAPVLQLRGPAARLVAGVRELGPHRRHRRCGRVCDRRARGAARACAAV
jgi:DNA-directed RNA polymerase beta subunit